MSIGAPGDWHERIAVANPRCDAPPTPTGRRTGTMIGLKALSFRLQPAAQFNVALQASRPIGSALSRLSCGLVAAVPGAACAPTQGRFG